MKIFIMVLVLTMLAVPSFAEITPKVAVTYNLDSEQIGEAIGGSIKEDLFGIKGLDSDVLVASKEVGDTLTDDDKTIIKGLSYSYDINDKCGLGVGAGISVLKYSDNDLNIDEVDKYIYASVSYKF